MSGRYGLEIRGANDGDAPGLAELLNEFDPRTNPADVAQGLANLRRSGATAFIASEWGPPSGVVLLHPYHRLERAQSVAQVTLLYVGREARRHGVARLLIKSASQWARSAGCAELELRIPSDSPDLEAFASATGFDAGARLWTRGLRKRA